MAKDLDTLHPDYQITLPVRTTARDFFEGEDVVKAKTIEYLYKEKNELQENFDLRLKRAVVNPFAEKIINARQAVIFHKPVIRVLPDNLEAHITDIDQKGNHADTFFRQVTEDAQVDGIAWVVVDRTRVPMKNNEDGTQEPEQLSQAQVKELGIRFFFEEFKANQVLDWQVNQHDRKLDWVVTKYLTQIERIPGEVQSLEAKWKVWYRDRWEIWKQTVQQEGGKGTQEQETFVLESTGLHDLKVVPVIPFLGAKRNEQSGWSILRNIIGYLIQGYNKESDLDWFERLSSHPIPYAISVDKPEKLDSWGGLWIPLPTEGPQPQIGYLETTGQGFDSIRKSLDSLKARVFSVALAQNKKETAQVQSADGQREDRQEFNAGLKSASTHYEEQETQCWNLAALWESPTGQAPDPESISISYNRDFTDTIINDAMLRVLSDMVNESLLSRETFLQILIEGEILPGHVDIEEELKRLKEGGLDTGSLVESILSKLKQSGAASV